MHRLLAPASVLKNACSNDRLVPMWCSEDFKKTYGEAAELIVVEDENHCLSKKTRKVAELVTAFFDAK